MPTPETRRLTEAHRLAQARLGTGVVRQMLAVWPLLAPDDLDSTFRRWLAAVSAVVDASRPTSADLAAHYTQLFRSLELGTDAKPVPISVADPIEPRALATSMLVTGPVSIKSNVGRGVPLERAVDLASTASARSAMRHVLDGGRETVSRMLRDDQRAHGYRRVASGNACPYCANLDGIEFATDDVFQPHDGCACSSEPIYR